MKDDKRIGSVILLGFLVRCSCTDVDSNISGILSYQKMFRSRVNLLVYLIIIKN